MNSEGAILLDSVFDHFMKNGANIFNATRLAETEEEHCRFYYDFIQPANGSLIIDMGCGSGEVGAWFQKFNPSLYVLNVVNDPMLIRYMKSVDRVCLEESMDQTTIPDGIADNVMFNESIGYIPLEKAFGEAARILRPKGVLTIKDFSNVSPSKGLIHLENWSYTIRQPSAFIQAATDAGFSLKTVIHPPIYTKHWYDIMAKSEVARESAMRHDPSKLPLCTVLYYFVKGDLDGRSCDNS